MKKIFSAKWISSKKPAKQRKYRYNAPLHIRQKFMSVHLSKELIKKYGTRSITVVKGDKVKIVRGQFKGRENKVDRTEHKKSRVYITGVDRSKKDGSKSMHPVHPSNLIITELNLGDKERMKSLQRKKESKKTPEEEK